MCWRVWGKTELVCPSEMLTSQLNHALLLPRFKYCINNLNCVYYNVLQVYKTFFLVISPCCLIARGEEKRVVVIDGNILGLWANTLRGWGHEIMTTIFFDMLIKC